MITSTILCFAVALTITSIVSFIIGKKAAVRAETIRIKGNGFAHSIGGELWVFVENGPKKQKVIIENSIEEEA